MGRPGSPPRGGRRVSRSRPRAGRCGAAGAARSPGRVSRVGQELAGAGAGVGRASRRSEATSSSSSRPSSAGVAERRPARGSPRARPGSRARAGREAAQGLDEQEVAAGLVGASWRSRSGVVAGQAGVLGGEGDADLQAQDLGLLAVDLVARGGEDRRVGGATGMIDSITRVHGVSARACGWRAPRRSDSAGSRGGTTRDGERLADDGEGAGEGAAEASGLPRPCSAAVSSHHGSAASGCRRVATRARARASAQSSASAAWKARAVWRSPSSGRMRRAAGDRLRLSVRTGRRDLAGRRCQVCGRAQTARARAPRRARRRGRAPGAPASGRSCGARRASRRGRTAGRRRRGTRG
jgi:hypothetical protein